MKNLTDTQLSAIARIFSSGPIREMSRKGKSPLFARLVKESQLTDFLCKYDPISRLFDFAFAQLKKKANRHEYVYKAALTNKILLGTHSPRTASILTEFRVGTCKADLVILNGTATVYEIKSERDSLKRLQRQIDAYKTVFGYVNVIAGENHIESIIDVVSPDVGILTLSDRYQISICREAADQSSKTNPEAIFNCVRMSEAKRILTGLGYDIPCLPNTELYPYLRSQFIKLAPEEAHNKMVKVLRETRNLRSASDFLKEYPSSLRPAVLSLPLRKSDHVRLTKAISTNLCDALTWG